MSESPKRLSQLAEEEFRRAVEGLSPEDSHLMKRYMVAFRMRLLIELRIYNMLKAVVKTDSIGTDRPDFGEFFDAETKRIIKEILRDVTGLEGMEKRVIDCSKKSKSLLGGEEARLLKQMSEAARARARAYARKKIKLILKNTRGKKTNKRKKRKYQYQSKGRTSN